MRLPNAPPTLLDEQDVQIALKLSDDFNLNELDCVELLIACHQEVRKVLSISELVVSQTSDRADEWKKLVDCYCNEDSRFVIAVVSRFEVTRLLSAESGWQKQLDSEESD